MSARAPRSNVDDGASAMGKMFMGLDFLELVLEIEERFDIQLPEQDFTGIYTVADLHRLILSKLEHTEDWPCLTSVLFLRMRKALVELTGAERQEVAPGTDSAALLAPEHRRATWDALGRALELKLPPLERPLWMHRALLVSTVAPIVVGILALCVKAFAVGGALLAGGIAYGVVACRATRRFAIHPPAGCDTLGGLAKAILALNYGKLAAEVKRWNRDEVWDTLLDAISANSRLRPGDIRGRTPLRELGVRPTA